MSAPLIRLQHNAFQLRCTYGCNKWFKTTGGRTRHNRKFHKQFDNPLPINNDPLIDDNLNPLINNPFINNDPPINDNPLFNDDPFEDLPEPNAERNESPFQDEIKIHHHPLINGA